MWPRAPTPETFPARGRAYHSQQVDVTAVRCERARATTIIARPLDSDVAPARRRGARTHDAGGPSYALSARRPALRALAVSGGVP